MTDRERVRRQSTWIVCPMCDEPVCLYHGVNCPEIEAFVDRKLEELKSAAVKIVEDAILG